MPHPSLSPGSGRAVARAAPAAALALALAGALGVHLPALAGRWPEVLERRAWWPDPAAGP